MNEYISKVYTNKELKNNDASLIDLEHTGNNDDINDINLNFFRFAHQLMSFYYGDKKWYTKTATDYEAKDNIHTINSIEENRNHEKFIVKVGDINYMYYYGSIVPPPDVVDSTL